jgi:simple sugar transport system ATP-binding protein
VACGNVSRGELGIEATGLAKAFGHVQALVSATLSVHRGEVVALFGDNGAGKSTLLKCICGVLHPDAGVIKIDGQPVALSSVRDAQRLGIDVVFQDLALAPELTVAENIFLGHELYRERFPRWLGVLDRRLMERRADGVLRSLGIHLPSLDEPVKSLSGGQRQAVAIARATMWARSAILFDEPTAALGARQSEIVMQLVRRIAGQGLAVLVISHDIPRMLSAADRLVVMRHGSTVWESPAKGVEVADVVTQMVSGEVAVGGAA